ncbi:zinc finger protein 58-like [Pecten maximus]|uniref:zinc finger protein 58-like n=1 Tax=Pecten maximus TaxID=6579 RepID=UPI001458F66F|nr:zinc finger protein 58-like [Pecten maximus]
MAVPTPPLLDKCEVCGKYFSSPIALLIHMRDHAGEEVHSCHYCGKGFTLRGSLQHHMQKHGAQEPQYCDLCGKWCSSKISLIQHRNTHQNERTFKCNICGMECKTKMQYMNHMRRGKHKKVILNHSCQKCGEAFMFKKDLARHKKLHIEVKPFECQKCFSTFWSISGYRGHLKRHEKEESKRKDYRCHLCTAVFHSPESLLEHSRVHNDNAELNVQTSDQLEKGQKQDNIESKVRKSKKKCKELRSSNSNLVHFNSQTEGKQLDSSVLQHLVPFNLCKYSQELDSAGSSNLVHSNLYKDSSQELNTSSSRSTIVHPDSHKNTDSSEKEITHTYSPRDKQDLDSKETNFDHSNLHKDSIQELNSSEPDLVHSHKYFNEKDRSVKKIVHTNSQNDSREVKSSQTPFLHTKTQNIDSLICEICGKCFSRIQSLKTHQKIHTVREGFECVLCKKVFMNKCYLERHYKHHSGEWYFPCNLCDEGFDKKVVLGSIHFSEGRCPPGYIGAGQFCLFFTELAGTWAEANSYCRTFNAELFEPRTDERQNALVAALKKVPGPNDLEFFIGGSDFFVENQFIWSTESTPVGTTHWYPGNPSNSNNWEDCMAVLKTGQWNDIACDRDLRFVCGKYAIEDPAVVG